MSTSVSATLDPHDPSDVTDYGIDWTDKLGDDSDTISTSSWGTSSPTGLTVASSPAPSISGLLTIVWVSGGTAGTNYQLTNTITTAAGRTWQRTITIPCRNR